MITQSLKFRRIQLSMLVIGVMIVALVPLTPLGAAEPTESTETAATAGKKKTKEKGFMPLLDDRGAWVGYGKDQWPEGWELNDGVLHRTASGGDLRTAKKYRSFDLRWEWKISPGGNSGVMYRVDQRDAPAYHTGPEYQILDDAKHADGRSPLTSTGALYGLYPVAKEGTNPVGQWNKSRIVVRGNRVRHFLNGKKIVEAEIGSPEWNERVAESKFAAWEDYGDVKRGYIVLQDHGDEVWYRNLRIKELRRPNRPRDGRGRRTDSGPSGS